MAMLMLAGALLPLCYSSYAAKSVTRVTPVVMVYWTISRGIRLGKYDMASARKVDDMREESCYIIGVLRRHRHVAMACAMRYAMARCYADIFRHAYVACAGAALCAAATLWRAYAARY